MVHAAGSRHSVSITRESTFGTTPTASLKQITTIDASATDNSYNDSTEDLSVFKIGEWIFVEGFSNAANNGLKHIVSSTANKLIVEETLVTESAGPVVDVSIGWEEVRYTGTTADLMKDTFTSEEIRNDRQISDLRHGNKRAEGDVSIELSYGAFDRLLEAVLQGTWSGNVLKAGIVDRSFSLSRLFDDIGRLRLFDGMKASAMSLSVSINAIVSGSFTFVGQSAALATDVKTITPGGTIEIGDIFNILDAQGNTLVSFVATAGTVANVTAGLVSAWNLSTNPICTQYTAADVTTHLTLTADATGTWYGLQVSEADGGGNDTQTIQIHHSPVRPATAAASNPPFDGFTGSIKEGGATIGVVTELELTLDNGMESSFVLMSDEAAEIPSGRSNLTGQIVVHVEDLALQQKFVGETPTSLEFTLTGPNGNSLKFELPSVKYTSGEAPVDGEGPIMLTMPFQALRDDTEETNLKITRTVAP